MNNNRTKIGVVLGLAGSMALLAGCASEPSPWSKPQSPWDQRREAAPAPAADQYKQDLAMDQGTQNEVELSYQTEPVESYSPAAEEAATMASLDTAEPVAEPEPMADPMMGDDFASVPADYYTVQLVASVDAGRVYKFAEQHQLSTRYVVPTRRDGLTWHVLLLDVYPDYASARQAMEEVAAGLPTKPWIRKVGSVQKLM